MPSFATALSGLESNNTALNTIANNLANMNTIGYKDQTDQFSTLFYQQLNGGVNGGVQVGVGTQVATTETDFSNGSPSTHTGQSTNMALQGNDFFVIDDHGQQELTRAGDFVLSKDGALQTTSGASVMGYPAANGSISVGKRGAANRHPARPDPRGQADRLHEHPGKPGCLCRCLARAYLRRLHSMTRWARHIRPR